MTDNREEPIEMVSDIEGKNLIQDELSKWAELLELAEDTTDSETLSELSVSPYVEVREAVARNCNTSINILRFLLTDEDWQVRETAILNTNTPLIDVEKFIDDENEFVRNAVISRKKHKF